MNRFTAQFKRAREIFQKQGFIALLGAALRFIKYHTFRTGRYYLCEYDLVRQERSLFLAGEDNFRCKIVSKIDDAQALTAEGFKLHLSQYDKDKLNNGAIAFYIFSGRELAQQSWVALTREAHEAISRLPINIDYMSHAAYVSGVFTAENFRRQGLAKMNYARILQYLCDQRRTKVLVVIPIGNISSRILHEKVGFKPYARAYYLKILWRQYWREKEF